MPSAVPNGRRIERALVSVDDKAGLETFVRGLARLSVEIWATSGTRAALASLEPLVRPLEELTGIGSWFGGRLKTLHPSVFGGILAPRTADGTAELAQHRLLSFDLVVVGFYPFSRHLAADPASPDLEEFIDIGGVALARAAAKNHRYVAVVTDPSEYGPVLTELERTGGTVSAATRARLARLAFERCAAYDRAIAGGLARTTPRGGFPDELLFGVEPVVLRYGENPHQAARVYAVKDPAGAGLRPRPIELLHGDPLSYTNLLDLDTALATVEEFEAPAAAIVKHATPCGVASAPTLGAALGGALATDPVARYGCAVAVNRALDEPAVAELRGVFVDLLAAPDMDAGARTALARRAKLKLVRVDAVEAAPPAWEARSALGRLLVQETDRRVLLAGELRHVAGPPVPLAGTDPFDFPWRVVRHAKSNAIVLAEGRATVGIGSGQPTRVKAVELACQVAGDRARGAILASDAFFPFADGVEVAARAGVRAIVQPGGSVRDPDVIAAAERAGVAMYFTGWRAFRH